jgi:diguanylate cyclase (GGDEF)-like protein
MESTTDQEDLIERQGGHKEWLSWRRHRTRIYLLVLISLVAVLAGLAVFALRPLHGQVRDQLLEAAQIYMDQVVRVFDAQARVYLQHAERLASDEQLTQALTAPEPDPLVLGRRLAQLFDGQAGLTGLALLHPDGSQWVDAGEVAISPFRTRPRTGVRPVNLPVGDAGLAYTLTLRDADGQTRGWLLAVFDASPLRQVLAPDVLKAPAPFIVSGDEVFFSPLAVRVQMGHCGGIQPMLASACEADITLLQRPVAGTDWSLVMMLDNDPADDRAATAVRWLPTAVVIIAVVLLALTALVLRPLDKLFARTGKLYELSARDELTGLSNRRHLMQALKVELARASRHRLSLNVMLLDIDRFKVINDTHGHAVGDLAIKEIAEAVLRMSRSEDVTARLGGDEFVVVQTDVDLEGAVKFAERLRRNVSRIHVETGGTWVHLSISVGVAHVPAGMASQVTRERVLGMADRALYKAKAGGRNKVAARGLRARVQQRKSKRS